MDLELLNQVFGRWILWQINFALVNHFVLFARVAPLAWAQLHLSTETSCSPASELYLVELSDFGLRWPPIRARTAHLRMSIPAALSTRGGVARCFALRLSQDCMLVLFFPVCHGEGGEDSRCCRLERGQR